MSNLIRFPLISLVFAASFASAQHLTPKEALLPSLSGLVDSVKAAVVNVDVQKKPDERLQQFELFRRQGEDLRPGLGSGFIVDPKGLVLTNNHVVEDAVGIQVRLDDGRAFDAEVLGRDPLTDVALLRLKGKVGEVPALRLGDSASVRPGDWVMAIVNPFKLASSVSLGIISALDREIGMHNQYDQFLQTDAAINPGNSGGPLFNMRGEVVGMNTAIVGSAGGTSTGIGFAVPSNLIKAVLPQLQKEGHVTRGWLGVSIQDLTPGLAKAMGVASKEGALIVSANEGSPAAAAGIKPEDVVVAIDGEKVTSGNGLSRIVALKRPGSTVALQVLRAGKPLLVSAKLGTRPDFEKFGDLVQKGSDASDVGSRLGAVFRDIDPRDAQRMELPKGGVIVLRVSPGSAADKSGLAARMLVLEANRKPLKGKAQLEAILNAARSGDIVLLRVALENGTRLIGLEIP